jgi:photosystem II stability/assembly factor-like uncharacterized protein
MSPLRIACVTFLTSLTLLPIASHETWAQGHDRDDAAREAWTRSYRAMRFGDGEIAPDAQLTGYRAFGQLPPAQQFGADAAWRALGPLGLFANQETFNGAFGGQIKAGRITSVAIHPSDGRTLIVGSASGGVWRSPNGGYSWSALTDSHCSLAIGAVAVDPVNPNLMYAGTGELNTTLTPGCGVLRSFDGGTTWTGSTSNPVGAYHGGLVIDRASAGSATTTTLVVATSGGVYTSSNSGATWTRRITGVAWSVVGHPTRPGVFFAAVTSTARTPATTVWKSTDAGLTWTALPTHLTLTQVARVELAISAAAPDLLFALTGDYFSRRFAGIHRWSETTQTWTRLPAAGVVTTMAAYPLTFGEQSEYNLVIAVDPRNANRIWVAGVGAFVSDDGGLSFKSTARNVHVDWHSMVFDPRDPDHMVAGTDGGVYSSFDGGRTWQAQNNGLAIAQFYQGISVHPSGLFVYGGLQDNQAVYYTGSQVWNNLSALGDGGSTVVNPKDPTIVYVTHAFLNAIRRVSRFREEDRYTGINPQDRFGIPRPIAIDPVTPTTLYFGTQRLYKTTNEGLQWLPISTDLTRGSGYITTIAVAPSDPAVIYIGTSDGVVTVTRNGGATYTQFVFANARWFTEIAVDPVDPLHAIAVASTLGAPHATETRDGGGSFFTTVGNGLPDIPVHSAMFLPGTNIFMVGTEYGVLQTTLGTGGWLQGPPGLPSTIVYDLAYAPATSTIFASTHGRGIFAYRTGTSPVVLRGDVDGDGRLSAQDALLIQQALVGMELPPGRSAFPHGDANCDGRLQGVDVLLVLRAAVGFTNPGTCVGTMFNVTLARAD